MKRLLIVMFVLVVVATSGFAQFRADIGFDIPWRLGATVTNAAGDQVSESLDVLSEFTFLLPDLMFSYEGVVGPVHLGVGARMFTLILESIAYPAAFAELDLGQLTVNFNVGGGAFLFFGLYNDLATGQLFLPDLSAHLKLGQSFRVGLGTIGLVGELLPDANPFIVYLSGKFVVRP